MSQEKVMNRWLIVPAAILIQICLGVMYAWSVFTKPLTEPPYTFDRSDTQIILSTGLAVFALVMIFAGRMLGRISPRILCAAGGLLLGLGYMAASLVTESFWGLLLTLGVVGGAGVGLAYVVPISVGVKWFPDKKGMLTGLSVAGFGFGALIWIHVAGEYGGLIANYGIPKVFLLYGVFLAVLTVAGSFFMVNPPEGYSPPGWQPPPAAAHALRSASGSTNLSAREMLATPHFYILWFMFMVGSLAGLMVIGNIKLFSFDALTEHGVAEDKARAAGDIAMGVFLALANGLGRVGWGMFSDKLGRVRSLAISFFIQGLVMLAFFRLGSEIALLYVAATIIGFNYGGCFALFPAATADFFGSRNVGANYAWVFTAYGVGGIVGPILAGRFGDLAEKSGEIQQWQIPFVIAGIACLVSAGLTWLLRSRPAKTAALEETQPLATDLADAD